MTTNPRARWALMGSSLRWIARVCSILSVGVLLLFFVGEGFNPTKVAPREWVGLLFFPFGVVVGLMLAWWREGLGGVISVGSLLAFYVLYGLLLSGAIPRGSAFLLFAAPGGLFVVCWMLSASVRKASA